MPLGAVAHVLAEAGVLNPETLVGFWNTTRWTFATAALVLGPVALGFFAFKNRLAALTLRLRGAIDVLLDVDSYMREHPRTRTPRARISARYASLLRHVLAGRYDVVIIVAHSQGSVIAAEFLRFVHAQHRASPSYLSDAGLDGLSTTKLRLFTMGCPLQASSTVSAFLISTRGRATPRLCDGLMRTRSFPRRRPPTRPSLVWTSG